MAVNVSGAQYDRIYLEGLADQCLKAYVAHDPTMLPLAKTVKYTENAQEIQVGEGLWLTASDVATYRLYACDPQEGQVGFFGVMKENGVKIIISLRIKTEGRLITEIETLAIRPSMGGPPGGDGAPNPVDNLIEPNPIYLETLDPSERVSREEMIRISDLYFEGLVQDNGDIVPYADDCYRIENGMMTANNPNARPFPGTDLNIGIMDCRTQMNSKFFAYIKEIVDRRYAVVDEERGLTFGMFLFHHPGTVNSAIGPDGRKIQMIPAARKPFSVIVGELFKIKNGLIHAIEANMTVLPYRAKSGWENKTHR